jgi:hypothetical protein
MTLPSTTPQDSHAILVAVLLLTGLCVVYWRMALRLIVIITLGLALFGLIATLHL